MSLSNGTDMETTPSPLHTEVRGEILLVRLSRPQKRNAMNDATVLGIEKIFSNIPEGIKCAVIYGEGKHFSAGLDLSELTERDAIQGMHHSRMWHQALADAQAFAGRSMRRGSHRSHEGAGRQRLEEHP